MGSSQPWPDFEANDSQSSESQLFAQSESSAPARHGRPITFRACAECRKKRAKCDQKRPCERCQRHGISECYDDTAILQSKEDLRTELQSLRQRQDCTDQLLSAVVEPGLSTQIIDHLRAGQSVDTILGWVKEARSSSGALSSCASSPSGGALPSFSEHASRKIDQEPANATAPSEIAINVPGYTFGLEQSLWPRGPPTTAPSPIAWTDISSDTLFINHLLALYFCWEYPIFASLSKEHFMNDYHHGRHRYCSSLLVNSLLALGNRWSHRHDGNTSGDKFFAESVRLLEQETDRRSLTTVRALSAMSMREVSCGRDAGARYYSIQAIRLAIDMGLHRKIREGDLDLYHVQLSTFWGAFSLDS